MTDPYSELLDLAVRLTPRQPGGPPPSHAEHVILDILWIGTQVYPNGFDGWLAHTSCERIRHTLAALAEVECVELLDVVRGAVAAAGVDPGRMTDAEREAHMDALTGAQRAALSTCDEALYAVYEPSMAQVWAFARRHGPLQTALAPRDPESPE